MNRAEYLQLNEGERWLVDWQYNSAGHFVTALFELFGHADLGNLSKLWIAFPEATDAFRRYSQEDGYWEGLQKRLELS